MSWWLGRMFHSNTYIQIVTRTNLFPLSSPFISYVFVNRRCFIFPSDSWGNTLYRFYQDTTEITSRKRLCSVMLSIYIVLLISKTTYKHRLPWQHPCEVGEYYCPYVNNRNPRPKSEGLRSEHGVRSQTEHGHLGHSLWALKRSHLSHVATVSINTGLYIV